MYKQRYDKTASQEEDFNNLKYSRPGRGNSYERHESMNVMGRMNREQ